MKSNANQKKVKILYGWGEGKRYGKEFRKLLRKNGYRMTNKTNNADIIIAHSGGNFLLPYDTKAQVILLIGLPYWPGKHPIKSLREKLIMDFASSPISHFMYKTIFIGIYTFIKPRYHYKIWKNRNRFAETDATKSRMVVVRNQHDSFTHPYKIADITKDKWTRVSLPGGHDDLWENPKKYIDLITTQFP
ncbi:MAG: hypothetical protein M3Q36_00960 [bacterium]|nr:hypothetical protein [bacterium]